MPIDLFYITFVLVLIISLLLAYKKVNGSIFFSPLIMDQTTFVISITTFIYTYYAGYVSINEFFLIFLIFLIFLFTYSIIPYFISNSWLVFKKSLIISNLDKQVTRIFIVFTVLIVFVYAYFLSNYSSGDERLILNRKMRYLSMLQMIFYSWSIYLSSLIYAKTHSKEFFSYVILLLCCTFFTGSKGATVGNLFIVLFFYIKFNNLCLKKMFKYYFYVLFLLFLPTFFLYGEGAIQKVLHRILMSADIYHYSFIIGDYKALFGFYDPLSYILHPFSALIGFRGYDYPLGAQILSTAGLNVAGVGPNPQLPILALVLFEDELRVILFSIATAFSMFLCVLFASFVLNFTKVHLFMRVMFFMTIYTSIYTIFLDIGLFQFNIIVLIFCITVYFILLSLKVLTTKIQ